MTTQHHLWDADGNPTALSIDITPQPLDATPVAPMLALGPRWLWGPRTS